jgi:TolB protein
VKVARGPGRAAGLLAPALLLAVALVLAAALLPVGYAGGASAPGGGLIAFTGGGYDEIYVMAADGSGQRPLTSSTDRNHAYSGSPAWSPDGKQIAFAIRFAGSDTRSDIYVLAADGSGQRRLTTTPEGNYDPAWSPDGKRIAFYGTRGRSGDIYVMAADGSGQRRLTTTPTGPPAASSGWPAWSPDGKRIAFASSRDGNYEIYVMAADGSGQRRLTRNIGPEFDPAWSPDGKRIAFTGERDGLVGSGEIYVMAADGSGQRRLTRSPSDGNNAAYSAHPTWSPDGKRIAFTRSEALRGRHVYVMAADGSGQRQLADGFDPAWQPAPARG